MKTVVGVFSDVGEAQRTFEDLTRMGFSPNEISIVTRSERATSERMRLSTIDAPDTGRIAACGPIATALTQRNGGLIGTLKNAGVSEALAERYAAAVRHGDTLESLVVEDKDAERVVDVMKRRAAGYESGGRTAESRLAESGTAGAAAAAGTEAATGGREIKPEKEPLKEREYAPRGEEDAYIPVMQEELRVGKREVERGGVHVDVRVVEKPVAEHITLREEHVEVERRPVDRAPRADETLFKDGQIEMTERAEEAVVAKEVRVVEEVHLHKTVAEHDEVIRDKLRSTNVDVEELANERKAYRAHFDSLGRKGAFEEDLPAYEYGRTLRGAPDERWEDVESNARTRWESTRPGTWEKYKDAIRHAWSRARSK